MNKNKIIGVDIDGNELEEYRVMRSPWEGVGDPKLYCVMQGKSGSFFLVSIFNSPFDDVTVKPISEATKYEVAAYPDGEPIYEDSIIKSCKQYRKVLKII